MAKHDELKKTLYNFYANNDHLTRREIYDRFINISAPKRSLNRWLVKLFEKKL